MNTRSPNTGGNIDTTFLATIRQRGLAKLSVIVPDRLGSIGRDRGEGLPGAILPVRVAQRAA